MSKKEKIYRAKPEFISMGRRTAIGGNTDELSGLETGMNDFIKKIVEWRVKHFGEKYWTEALPQTLKAILEGYDRDAAEVAAKGYLSGKLVEKRVEVE